MTRRLLIPLEQRILLAGSVIDHADTLGIDCGTCLATGSSMHAKLAAAVSAASPLSALPSLSSKPSAPASLYLDFDGDAASTWFVYSVPPTPAYDQDGDPTTFSNDELQAIQEIWARVAEMYSPFNINVTTVDPGNLNDRQTLRAVIGGNGAWTNQSLGGIAQIGGFSSPSLPNTVYVFEDNLANGDVKYVALTSAHEAGHGFGLEHQSLYDGSGNFVNSYNPGDASRAPILGNARNAARGLWWNGTTSGPSTFQDDLAILSGSNNAFGYRADDHGNATGAASALTLSGATATGAGVITQVSDRDYFSFTTTGGSVTINADVAQYGAMLDLKLELLNSSGSVVTSADTSALGESITRNLAAGTYYVVVASHGSYGDIGQYTITATLPAGAPAVPILHSRPLATAKLYLDFDGQAAMLWGSQNVPATPAYDTDGNALSFTAGELASIEEIWQRVSEKFSPFNVDVTTEDPGNRNDRQTLQVVIGGDGSWASSTYTGIAKVGGFYNTSSNTVFVFEERLANGWPKYTAEIAAHEAGHGFGLSHQSRYSGSTRTEDYHTGDGTKAPIMGNSTGAARGVWWNGTTSSSTTFQDDLAILSGSGNAFGYRADDHGGTTGSATALGVSGNTATGAGVIAQASDLDYFSFTTTGGSVSINAAVPAAWAMLDLKLEVRNSSNAVVASASTANWGESITTALAAGTYYVVVAGQGQYGDLGSYTLSVSLPTGVTPAPVAHAGGPYSVNEGSSITLSASGSTGSNLVYAWDLDGDGLYGETGAAAARGSETGATPTFSAAGMDGPSSASISLRVTDDQARTSTTSASISISNVAPKLTISGNSSVNEGSIYTLDLSRSDVGPDTITSWTINWGDGTSPQVVSGDPSSVTHMFADNGTRTISATATDEDGTHAAGGSKSVTVNNVAPTIALSGSASVNEGESYTLTLGTITDPGIDTVTQWIVEWGDGASTTYTTSGAKSHTYADGPANRNIVVRLVDEDGTHVAGSKAIAVHNVPPTLTIGGNDAVNEGSAYTLNLSRTDVGSDLLSAWTINWGDGQTQTIGGASASVTHVYTDNGTRTISATATDEDGTYAAGNTKAVTINNVAPSLSLGGAGSATAGATFNLLMSASDPGADTVTSWLINWGDGAVQTLSGNPSSAGHVYAAAGTYTITATATDEDGSYNAGRSLSVTSDVPKVVGKAWIGPASGGNWSDPSNWSPAGIPGRDDKVTLTDARVSLSSNVAIAGLTLQGTAALDIRDHALVIDYGEVGPLEMWDGKGYTGISGMIASGAVFSSTAAQGESVAAVEAREALRLSTTATATWSGVTVDGSSVLVKLTLGGDANLNSQVNIDDYGRIDASVASLIQEFGWFNGDFNLDGKINVDDYGIIDLNQAA